MKRRKSILKGAGIFLVAVMIVFTATSINVMSNGQSGCWGKIVVANRASGTISVISAYTDDVIGTYDLPVDDNDPEPMYVVYVRYHDRVFVGDRANDRVVVFDADDFSVETTIDAGQGVFHMWADKKGKLLWVNNDIDNTATIINPRTLAVINTVDMPADLIAMGGKPHDVIIDPWYNYAYVTFVGISGDNDYVVKFNTKTFEEVDRTAVGKDPHVMVSRFNPYLFVASQGSDKVFVLNRWTMDIVKDINVPGAHGVFMTRNGRYLYTTNLPGGGSDALYTIDTWTLSVAGEPVDSPYSVPHNIVLTKNNRKLYVTHSGPNDKVSVYSINKWKPNPVYIDDITVGDNPFGLTYVP